ncbi:MAG TPA: endonuclease/exonuclease/phosphatase family protein [Planctomycetaceae bacterium]|nr:endonuclease/exonuclease/phosphatase family protein [Planctomycetaceae bacterium]
MARKKSSKRKSSGFSMAVALLLVLVIGAVNFHNGKFDLTSLRDWFGRSGLSPQAETRQATVPIPKAPGTIRLGPFNIQVFGQSKLEKPDVMGVLADVVRQFDLLAIQEIRTQDDGHLDTFLQMINATGRQYRGIIGPRLGRSNSTEQYAFVYDSELIEPLPGSVYTIDDPYDRLHREPLIAAFRVRGPPDRAPFTFRLINIHTDPDETKQELDALADVFATVQQQDREDDTILLGDLNVDARNFGRLAYHPGITPVITTQFTNTRGNGTMDNIVFDSRFTVEATGQGGVMNLFEMYGLSHDEALQVSDHLPVWADFSMIEGSRGPVVQSPDYQRQ